MILLAANTLFAGLKVTAKELWNKADEEKRRVPDELLEEFQEQVENQRPVDDVAKELEALRAELSMAENINPGIIDKFEKLTEAVCCCSCCMVEQGKLSCVILIGWRTERKGHRAAQCQKSCK